MPIFNNERRVQLIFNFKSPILLPDIMQVNHSKKK